MAQRHQYKVFKILLQSLLRSYCTAKGPYRDVPEMQAHNLGIISPFYTLLLCYSFLSAFASKTHHASANRNQQKVSLSKRYVLLGKYINFYI